MELDSPNRPPSELPGLYFTVVGRCNHLEPIIGQPGYLVAVRVDRGQYIDSGKQRIGSQGHPLEAKLRDRRLAARVVIDQRPRNHLVTVTNAEHDPVLMNGSSNQCNQGVICWMTTGGRQIRSTDHDMAAFRIQYEALELIEIHDMDRTPRDLLEPRNDGSGKPFPFFGSRNAVDDQDHCWMLTS